MVLLFSWILVIQNKKYDMTHLSFLYSLYGITIIEQLIIFPISYIWPRVIHSFSSLFYFRVKYSSVILALFQASSKQPKFFYPFPLFVCPRSPHCPYRPLSYPCPRFHFPCLPLALPLTPLSLVPIFVPVPWVSVHQVASILVSISNSSKLVDMIKGVRAKLRIGIGSFGSVLRWRFVRFLLWCRVWWVSVRAPTRAETLQSGYQ